MQFVCVAASIATKANQPSLRLRPTVRCCAMSVTTKRPLLPSRTTTLPELIRLLANSRSDFCSDALSIRARDEVSRFRLRELLEAKTENLPPPMFEALVMNLSQFDQRVWSQCKPTGNCFSCK